MAEEREIQAEGTEAPQAPSESGGKKKRKKGCGCLLLFLALIGAVVGLHAAGLIDARKLVFPVLVRIPYAGSYIERWFNIPKEYTLTPYERRLLELQRREHLLNQKLQQILDMKSKLEALSKDLLERKKKIEEEEKKAQEVLKKLTEEIQKKKQLLEVQKKQGIPEEKIKELAKYYEEIKPRSAAEILSVMDKDLAVAILKQLPDDLVASIISKMDPQKAAEITKLLAESEER